MTSIALLAGIIAVALTLLAVLIGGIVFVVVRFQDKRTPRDPRA